MQAVGTCVQVWRCGAVPLPCRVGGVERSGDCEPQGRPSGMVTRDLGAPSGRGITAMRIWPAPPQCQRGDI